ncbi:MAG: T9SS type A sorting domain-containing protein [Candidatus Cloacimonetes bacterium]|nr:T9SS type A sorting domain-containing protein [Candidatus Cloacimonadota bacterium]
MGNKINFKTILYIVVTMLCFCFLNAETIAEQPSNYNDPDAGTEANPYLISNLANLRWFSENYEDWYINRYTPVYLIQTDNIDASETRFWNNMNGFQPIGQLTSPFHIRVFVGVYNGAGHVISNLYALRNGYASLFEYIESSIIMNLGVVGVDLGGSYVYGIAETAMNSLIRNCYTSGNINSEDTPQFMASAAGIVGRLFSSTIMNSYSSVNITARGTYGPTMVGGIAGLATDSIITDCYATGNIIGVYVPGRWAEAGGIVSSLTNNSIVQNCYFSGNVSGTISVGGIAGEISSSYILNCYTTGIVSGNYNTGGIAGNTSGGIIENSYVTGYVLGPGAAILGGAYAGSYVLVINSYFDIETVGKSNVVNDNGITQIINSYGLPTSEMKQIETYIENGWNFDSVWSIEPIVNDGYPYLMTIPPFVFYPPNNLLGVVAEISNLHYNLPGLVEEISNLHYNLPEVVEEISNLQYSDNSLSKIAVFLTWENPDEGSSGAFDYYRIYRDDICIKDNFTENSFIDFDVLLGTIYTYYVTAYYVDNYGVSNPSNVITIKIEREVTPNPVVLLTPENEAVEVGLRPVFKWTLPTEGGEIEGLRFYIESEHIMSPPLRDCFVGNSSKEPRNDDGRGKTIILPPDTTEYTFEIDLEYETIYYWSVIAFNEYGDSTDNQVFSFTTKEYLSDKDENALPLITELLGNFPNPFNPETTIRFNLAVDSMVSIDIFNIRGQKIKSLLNDFRISGEHQVIWNGLDDFGRSVGSGVYFYQMITDEYSKTMRMLMLK